MKILIETLIKFCSYVSIIYIMPAAAMETNRWSSYNTPTDEFGPESTESNEEQNAIIHHAPVLYSSSKNITVPINNKMAESASEDDYEKRNYEYEKEVTSNLKKSEEAQEKIQKSGFSKYLRKHPKGKNFQIDNLTYEQKINTLNSLIEKTIKVNELELKKTISEQNNKSIINTNNIKINDSDMISSSFFNDIYTLGNLLGSYHGNLIEIGLGYYSHKFFRLYYNYCKPNTDDSLDVWMSKNKVFKTSIRCFLLQFETLQFAQFKTEIQSKSQNTLLKYFQDSCTHLINLYKSRSGVTMTLYQSGLRESQTKKALEEFTNNYLLDFNFIQKKKYMEEKFRESKVDAFREIDAIDAEIAKKGVLKTVLGESATNVTNIGSALVTQGTNLATQGLTVGVRSLYDYYYSSTTQPQQSTNGAPNINSNKESDPPKKGWFGW